MNTRIPSPTPPPGEPTVTTDIDGNPILPAVPFVSLSDKVSIRNIPGLLDAILDTATVPETGPCPATLIAHFVARGLPQKVMPLLPVHPDHLFLMAGDAAARNIVMAALAPVEIREPNYGKSHLGRLAISNNTPMRDIFRQMAAVPMTVFSVMTTQAGGTFFFLRTRFTVGLFLEELAKVLARTPRQPDPSSN